MRPERGALVAIKAATRQESGADAVPEQTAPADAAPAPSTPAPSRLLVLDGLRLVAALMVVAHHLVRGPWGVRPEEHFGLLASLAKYGWLGVNLFFLISGFVICMSSWGRSLGKFAVSRIVRLFPAYWVGVILTTAVLLLWPVLRESISVPQALANLTMLQSGLGVIDQDWSYWSLGAELRFYLLFAVVVWLGVTYRRVVYFCAVWTIVAAFASSLHEGWLENLIVPNFAPYFVAGTALFLIHRFGATLLLWGLVGVNWLIALYRLEKYDGVVVLHLNWWPVAAVVTVFWGIMIAVALGAFERVRGRWLITAGALTYPLYLIHQAIGQTLIRGLHEHVPAWPLLVALLALMLGTAWLIHRYVERPLGRRLKRGLDTSLAAARSA